MSWKYLYDDLQATANTSDMSQLITHNGHFVKKSFILILAAPPLTTLAISVMNTR